MKYLFLMLAIASLLATGGCILVPVGGHHGDDGGHRDHDDHSSYGDHHDHH